MAAACAPSSALLAEADVIGGVDDGCRLCHVCRRWSCPRTLNHMPCRMYMTVETARSNMVSSPALTVIRLPIPFSPWEG